MKVGTDAHGSTEVLQRSHCARFFWRRNCKYELILSDEIVLFANKGSPQEKNIGLFGIFPNMGVGSSQFQKPKTKQKVLSNHPKITHKKTTG